MVKTKKTYRKRKGGTQHPSPHSPGANTAPTSATTSAPTNVHSATSSPAPGKKGLFGISMPKLPNFTMGKLSSFFTRRKVGGRRKGRKGKRKTKRKGGARRSRKKNKDHCKGNSGSNKYKR
tara:strand:- start:158 stop:520 length:363 start_codon:yes stop_codon:yes gene_type:complete